MNYFTQFAAASAVTLLSLVASAQQAHAEQICEATWTRAEYPSGKFCGGNWGDDTLFGEIEIYAQDWQDPDGDQEIVLAVMDLPERCADELTCHFSWTGRSYDLTETENQKIVYEHYIPEEIRITCDCTPH